MRRLIKHPTEPSWIISAIQDNNEVTVWNLESGSKQQTLWASSAPPLSNSQVRLFSLLHLKVLIFIVLCVIRLTAIVSVHYTQ